MTPGDVATDAWLQRFLRGEGDNVALADGLRKQRRFYLGPIEFPLDRLVRCAGPEPGMEYACPEPDWSLHLDELQAALEAGWMPQPLIVYAATMVLMDGNHRAAMLTRLGRAQHETIFVFDSAAERDAFLDDEPVAASA